MGHRAPGGRVEAIARCADNSKLRESWVMRRPVTALCAFAVLGVMAILGVGCAENSSTSTSSIRVFAASSMTDVLPEIATLFEERESVGVQFSFAGSSALREQILDGADADVFISANLSVMEVLVDAGVIEQEPVVIAENGLTIAVPVGNPASVTGLADFENGSLALGVCAAGVPCGDLATRVFDAGGITPQVDTNEANVRALLTKAELAELDAALVYRTDVVSSAEVDEVPLPPHIALLGTTYAAGVLTGSGDAADAFVEFLRSAEAIEVFTSAGFDQP